MTPSSTFTTASESVSDVPVRAPNTTSFPPGSTAGQSCAPSRRHVSGDVSRRGAPPLALTIHNPAFGPGGREYTTTSPSPHEYISTSSAMLVTGPPASDTRLSFAPSTTGSHFPSGENRTSLAPSV